MKKIFTILCLMALALGAQAQVHVTKTGTDYLTADQIKAGAAAEGDFYVAIQNHQKTGIHNYITTQGKLTGTFSTTGATTWIVEKTDDNYYVLKTFDGRYISSLGGAQGTAAGFDTSKNNAIKFNPVQHSGADSNLDTSYGNVADAIAWNIVGGSNRMNTSGQNNIFQNTGTGVWTMLFTYAVSIKYNIVYKYYYNDELVGSQTSTDLYDDGEEVTITDEMVPTLTGYNITSYTPASITINGADAEVTVNCEPAATTYTLNATGAPAGTTFTVKGQDVADGGTVSITGSVAESDVVVTLPSGQSDFYNYTVTISGTTITVNFTALWPVSFDEGALIYVGDKVSSVTAATLPTDNDHWYIITQVRGGESVTFARGENEKLRRGTTAQTAASFNKTDATANGAYLVRFISTGENDLYKMQFGNAKFVDNGLKPSSTSITNAATYAFYNSNGGNGSYFGWNLNSKTGQRVDNNAAGNDVAFWDSGEVSGTSGNYVWYVYETTIDVPAYSITYIVNDENGDELFRSGKIAADEGQVITELPAEYQRTAFYTYNTVNVTINGDNEAVFTATLKEDAPVQFTADATNPIYYNLKIRGNYLVRKSDNTVPNQATSEPFNPAAAWAFIGTPYDGFSVINEQAGSGYTLMYSALYDANGNVFGRADIVTLRDDSGDKKWILETNNCDDYPGGFVLRAKDNTNVYLHQRGNNGLSTCAIVEWSNVHDDEGSTIIASTDKDALVELYNLLDGMEFGTGLNQYSEPTDFANVMAAANTVITNDEIANFADTYQTLKALQASITLNMPQAGFYRIKGKTNSKYLAAGLASNNKFNMSDAVDATTIFYYSGTKLINYSTGMENGMNASAWAWSLDGQGSEVTFEDGQTSGGYAIKSNNAYFYDGGTSADRGDSNDGNVRYNSWYLEEVPSLPITLRRTSDDTPYFATFSAPVPVEINGATLCSVEVSESGKAINYTATTNTQLAAGTGVLLTGESGSATATILTETEATDTYGLTGYSAAFAVDSDDKTMLFLGKNSKDKVGFYRLGSASTNGFKAYFANSTGGEAKEGFDLVSGNEVTGVESLTPNPSPNGKGSMYNLQGQRVNKAQKGVFIQNGKKVVVK